MRRVLHILSQRPSHTGSGTTLDAIVRQASCAGWQQHAIVGTPIDDPVPLVGDLRPEQIHPLVFGQAPLDFALPGMSDVMPYPSSRFSALTDAQLASYCDAWREHVVNIVEQVQPDVIHSHHLWLLSSLLKDITTDIPIVTHCHGTGLRQMKLCPHLASSVVAGCRRNDHFLALHLQQSDEIASILDVPRERVTAIGAGYREEIFYPPSRQDLAAATILYAGKLSRAKGVDCLLTSVDQLRETIPAVHLHVAGSGSGEEANNIQRRMVQLQSHVTWHGQLSPEQLAQQMRASHIFVLPSLFEGLPLVLVEAIACGCRVVATDLPGTRELHARLPSIIRLVAPPKMRTVDQAVEEELSGFAQRLAHAICEECSQARPANLAELIQPFTWKNFFQRLEQIWSRLAA